MLNLPVPAPGAQGAAVVYLGGPGAGSGNRPLLVATHGSFDRPEWHCDTWRKVFEDRVNILCPRGTLRWDSPKEAHLRRYFYKGGTKGLERAINESIGALDVRFVDRVSKGPMIYLGFSQGAILGSPMLSQNGARFPRAILIEGGSAHFNEANARRYAQSGGKKVLFACGQNGCETRARAAAKFLMRAGVTTRVVNAPGAGHTYDGPVAQQIRAAVSWLLE